MSAQRMYFIVAFGVTFTAWVLWLLLLPSIGLLAAYVCAINMTALLLYAWDKGISGGSITRVPEIVLHSVAFAGGSPMALLAQKVFHHKTRKSKFQALYWIIVLVQVGMLLLWI